MEVTWWWIFNVSRILFIYIPDDLQRKVFHLCLENCVKFFILCHGQMMFPISNGAWWDKYRKNELNFPWIFMFIYERKRIQTYVNSFKHKMLTMTWGLNGTQSWSAMHWQKLSSLSHHCCQICIYSQWGMGAGAWNWTLVLHCEIWLSGSLSNCSLLG